MWFSNEGDSCNELFLSEYLLGYVLCKSQSIGDIHNSTTQNKYAEYLRAYVKTTMFATRSSMQK